MSQTPRHIKTDRSLNRPTERRAEKAPASRPVQPAQPDFFAEEKPSPAEPPRRAGGNGGSKPPRHSAPAGGKEPPRRRKKKKKTPLWFPLAVTDRKSTRLNFQSLTNTVCRLLLEKKKNKK